MSSLLVTSVAADAPEAIRVGNGHFIDRIGFNQRAGIAETYGLAWRPRRKGPVAVEQSEALVTADQALLVWYPQHDAVTDLDTLTAIFALPPSHSTVVTLGFELADGSGFALVVKPLQAALADKHGLVSAIPDSLRADLPTTLGATAAEELHKVAAIEKRESTSMYLVGNRFWVQYKLDAEVLARLSKLPIKRWFLQVDGGRGRILGTVFAGLTRAGVPMPMEDVGRSGRMRGRVVNTGKDLPRNTQVELLTEGNERKTARVTKDGEFTFDGVPLSRPISLSLSYDNEDFHSVEGRWFIWRSDTELVEVSVGPHFVNPDRRLNDTSQTRVEEAENSPVHAHYLPHSRISYAGWKGREAEFLAHSFTNNFGYHDVDRFTENVDDCLRIGLVGSSLEVAIQVNRAQKYNALLESMLGVQLGRCVEVISAGRDSGNLGTAFPIVRDYLARFSPALILMDVNKSGLDALHPELLRIVYGAQHDKNKFDNFYYRPDGELDFRPHSKLWPKYAVEADHAARLDNGMPANVALFFPWKEQHRVARETWKYLTDITAYYRKTFPGIVFGLHSFAETSKLDAVTKRKFKLPDGRAVEFSRAQLSRNLAHVCAEQKLLCVVPPFPRGLGPRSEGRGLVWKFDGHLNERGHQFAAKALAPEIVAQLRAAGRATVPRKRRELSSDKDEPGYDVAPDSLIAKSIHDRSELRTCLFGPNAHRYLKRHDRATLKRITPRLVDGVRIERFPRSYRAMVAVSSDADQSTRAAFESFFTYFRTSETTPYGPGLGLDMAHSFFPYGVGQTWALFKSSPDTDPQWITHPEREAMLRYLRAGWIDTIHSYGDFEAPEQFAREMALPIVELLREQRLPISVWTNHGNPRRNLSVICGVGRRAVKRGSTDASSASEDLHADGAMQRCTGDAPGHTAYHTDLTANLGIRYAWNMGSSSTPLGVSSTLSPAQMSNGEAIWGFVRFSHCALDRPGEKGGHVALPLWHMVGFDVQASEDVLNYLVDNQMFSIMGQHFACAACGARDGTSPDSIPEQALAGMRRLKHWQDDGLILVARTVDLLNYNRAHDFLRFSVARSATETIIDVTAIDDPVFGTQVPTVDGLRGITFRYTGELQPQIRIAGVNVEPCRLEFGTVDGARTVGFRWAAGERPVDACARRTVMVGAAPHPQSVASPTARSPGHR